MKMIPTTSDWVRAATSGAIEWGGGFFEVLPGVYVCRAPARLDGVFWGVSAETVKSVCIALSGGNRRYMMLTPLVVDTVRECADIALDFMPDPSSGTAAMVSEGAMRRYSRALVRRLEQAGWRDDGTQLVCTGTKDWVETSSLKNGVNPYTGKRLSDRAACNYGAFCPTARSLSATRQFHVIQSPGYCHNDSHLDYSQLMRIICVTGGKYGA